MTLWHVYFMREHTKAHHTNKVYDTDFEEEDQPISSREFFKDAFDGRSEWAVHLRGFRTREGLTQLHLARVLRNKTESNF